MKTEEEIIELADKYADQYSDYGNHKHGFIAGYKAAMLEYVEQSRQADVSGSLPKNCYHQCKECSEWRMIGTFCKNPMTNQCDKDERYFYRGNDR